MAKTARSTECLNMCDGEGYAIDSKHLVNAAARKTFHIHT